jgi:hypothetical protein
MNKRSTPACRVSLMPGGWLRGAGASALLGLLVLAVVLPTTRAGAHASALRATATTNVVQGADVQYFTAINLADPGFSATATAPCPTDTFLISGTHLTPAGATLVSEGASDNAWVVAAQGTGNTPVFFTAVAACISAPATPALQTIQGTLTGTASVVVHVVTPPSTVSQPTQPLSLQVSFVGAPGFPWSIPNTGQITFTITVPNPTGGTLTITVTGSGVGQYLAATGSLVENVTLHASSSVGSIDLPITLTTGTASAGSITLTGSPVDAQGNITVVGVGTMQNGTDLVGTLLNGSTVAVTVVGTVAHFPTR